MTADDQPGASSEPADDEFVVDLLASLRDSVPIPAPVAARLDQALAEARLHDLDDTPAAQGDELGRRRERRPQNWLLALGAAAAVVVAIPVAFGVVNQSSTNVTASTSSDPTDTAAKADPGALGITTPPLGEEARAFTLVSNTGTAYTAAELPTQVQGLVAARAAYSSGSNDGPDQPTDRQAPGRTPSPSFIAPSPAAVVGTGASTGITFASDRALLAQCLDAITRGTPWFGALVAAVDVGSYGGAPAVVVVYPDTTAAGHWHVWVINKTCADPGRVLLSETV